VREAVQAFIGQDGILNSDLDSIPHASKHVLRMTCEPSLDIKMMMMMMIITTMPMMMMMMFLRDTVQV